MSDPFSPDYVDPARRRILERMERRYRGPYSSLAEHCAAGYENHSTISREVIRKILIEATDEVGSPELYALRLGCTPAFLEEVLSGRKRAAGDMLDILGVEWNPSIRTYGDPQRSGLYRYLQEQRIRRSLPMATRKSLSADPEIKSARRRLKNRVRREGALEAEQVDSQPAGPGNVVPFPGRARGDDDDLNEVLGRT